MKGLFNKVLVIVLLGSVCSAHAITFSINGETIFTTSLPACVGKAAEKVSKSVLQVLSSTKEAIVTEVAPFVNDMKKLGQEAWAQQPRLCIGTGVVGICALVVWRKIHASRKGCFKKRKSSSKTDANRDDFCEDLDSF